MEICSLGCKNKSVCPHNINIVKKNFSLRSLTFSDLLKSAQPNCHNYVNRILEYFE